MAESNLSLSFQNIKVEVALQQGWDRDPTLWSSEQNTDFQRVLDSGLRRFYFPPPLDGMPRYQWSFLKPKTTLAVSSSTFAYDLPDDFSSVIEPDSVSFDTGDGFKKLKKIDEDELRALQSNDDQSGTPSYYAVRAKSHDATSGLRWEILLYPTPNASFTITYRYAVIPNTIDATNKYPLGGAVHSETLLYAVLSACEEKLDDEGPDSPYYQKFLLHLRASIKLDAEQTIEERRV